MSAHTKMRRMCVLSVRCGDAKVTAGVSCDAWLLAVLWSPFGSAMFCRGSLVSALGVNGCPSSMWRSVLVLVAVVVPLMVMVVVQLLVHGACSRG